MEHPSLPPIIKPKRKPRGNNNYYIRWTRMLVGDRILVTKDKETYVRQMASYMNRLKGGSMVFQCRVNRETDEEGIWVMRVA